MTKSSFYDLIMRGALVALSVFLQVQITLFATDEYIGLRFNSADLLLPFFGLLILASLIFKTSSWPQWQKPFGYWAPALLSAVMIFALLNGYRIQGDWSSWAIINKGVGWCVLMAYLLMGAWFGTNKVTDVQIWFLRPFFIFLILILIVEIALRLCFQYAIIEQFTVLGALKKFELMGLMANRNAFAFLYLSILTVGSILIIDHKKFPRIDTICVQLLWLLLPLFLVMNASRTSFLIVIPLIIYLLCTNWRIFVKAILPMLVAGCIIMPIAYTGHFNNAIHYFSNLEKTVTSADTKTETAAQKDLYAGDQLRLNVIKDSLTLLKENPILGAGIGSVYQYQQDQSNRKHVAIIDNTPLWILTEMGPLGLLAFGSVFFSMLTALYRKSRGLDTDYKLFARAVFFILLGFGLFSLLHEILYTRFLWVFIGIALAVPAIKTHQN